MPIFDSLLERELWEIDIRLALIVAAKAIAEAWRKRCIDAAHVT